MARCVWYPFEAETQKHTCPIVSVIGTGQRRRQRRQRRQRQRRRWRRWRGNITMPLFMYPLCSQFALTRSRKSVTATLNALYTWNLKYKTKHSTIPFCSFVPLAPNLCIHILLFYILYNFFFIQIPLTIYVMYLCIYYIYIIHTTRRYRNDLV